METSKAQPKVRRAKSPGTETYRVKFRPETLASLKAIQNKLGTDKLQWSNSLIVRRTVEAYARKVSTLTSEADLNYERLQIESDRGR
jgi:hypothetical protein